MCIIRITKYGLFFKFIIFYLGFWGVGIYSTLQARSIGLSFSDISIVLGVIPITGAVSSPILGKNVVYHEYNVCF